MTTADQYADISSNNPLPDIGAYRRAGHQHLCRKVSQGTFYHWYDGDTVTDTAHGAGLHVGHYHWLDEDNDALAQAKFFIDKLAPHLGRAPTPGVWPPNGDWLMNDLERSAGKSATDAHRAEQLHIFNTYVAAQLPHYPLVTYTGNWYMAPLPLLQAEARRWLIVMSDYSGVEELPNPYHLTYAAWQYSDRAKVAGFSAPVDYNRWLPAPAQFYPGNPTLSEAVMLKVARSVAVNLMRAVLSGDDHGHYTAKRYPHLVGGHGRGIHDRVALLEQEIGELRKAAGK